MKSQETLPASRLHHDGISEYLSCSAPTWLTDVTGPVLVLQSDGTPAEQVRAFIPISTPKHEGLPFIQVSGGFAIGNNGEGELPQVGNSFQWSDNVSKVIGNHSLKFGGDVRRQHLTRPCTLM